MIESWKIWVCEECGELLESDDRPDSYELSVARGHYHDPPEGHEGEDPWFGGIEIEVARVSTHNPAHAIAYAHHWLDTATELIKMGRVAGVDPSPILGMLGGESTSYGPLHDKVTGLDKE